MRTYWQKRAESFGFDGDEDVLEKIQCQIARYLPKGRLKILDAGTGTGILAAAMALLGHDVTAIDLCSNMIEKAKANMERLGVEANFLCTAAGELPFEENTFDVVVSRNVTWVLPEPEQVLLQWQRVLKPGGLLIYLDGNHYYYLFHEEDRKNREWISRLNGSPHARDNGQVDYSLCDETALRLPLSRYDRPSQWDEKVLPRLGFDIVAEEIERPQQLLKYGIGKGYYTQFLIAARNGKGLELR